MANMKRARKQRLATLLRRIGWAYDVPRNGLRRRIYCLAMERHPWWDWGHRLMILVGMDFGGNWSEPEPPTWYYRLGPPKRMWRTHYPRHPLSTFQVVTDYDEFRRLTEGLNEDQMYEWKALNTNQDGELHLGHQYWGKSFYGLSQAEVALLRRYLRMWHRLDWFGLRSWLYSQALHAAVHRKAPRTCQVTPARGTGGYSHWYCGLPRRHDGPHRYVNYTWDGDPEHRVEYDPEGPEVDAQRARVIEEATAAIKQEDE